MCFGYGTSHDAVAGTVPTRDRVREEDTLREGRGEPVGETEMGVRLGQRRRDPAQPGGENHRARDVAAAAQHDVGPSAPEDAEAARTAPGRACHSDRRSPGLSARGSPETANVSSSKPASGTSRDSTRSGLPANVTVTPRSRSASATASAGRT